MMKIDDSAKHDARPAADQLLKLKKEQFNLRFQRGDRPAREDPPRPRGAPDIARIKTSARASPRRPKELRRDAEANSQGVVVSDKNDKTVVVKVERTFLHPV
jgi:ribosomal protein L29